MTKIKLSQRSYDIQASPIRKLTPYADEAKRRGIKVYHLNIGQPDIETPPVYWEAIRKYGEKVLKYGPSNGIGLYLESLKKYYNNLAFNVRSDDIFVTTAGSEAIIFSFLAVMNPGEEVIIPEPYYTNYNGFATMTGVKIVPLTTFIEEGFKLPPVEKIEEKITDRTRAILLCNPGNPTGTAYSEEELSMVVELAKKYNLFLIADEVYREFTYDGLKHTSIMEFPGIEKQAIVVDSISKRFSACGARVGCIVSKNKELMEAVMKFGQARLCPPTLEQIGAIALHNLGKDYFKVIYDEYKLRRDNLYEGLTSITDVLVHKPQGAFYMVARLPVKDTEDFAIWLLRDFDIDGETVMFAPLEGFYGTQGLGKNELRLAYILNCHDIEKSVIILKKGLEKYLLTGQ
jgi:aspartate aminotransferase